MSRFELARMSMLEPASSRTAWSTLTFMSVALIETLEVVGAPISIPASVIRTRPLGPTSSMPVSVMLSL